MVLHTLVQTLQSERGNVDAEVWTESLHFRLISDPDPGFFPFSSNLPLTLIPGVNKRCKTQVSRALAGEKVSFSFSLRARHATKVSDLHGINLYHFSPEAERGHLLQCRAALASS